MKREALIYGKELLVILGENENISFKNLEKISNVKGEELRELLKYLRDEKGFIIWKLPFSIGFIGVDGSITDNNRDEDKIKLSPKGIEVTIERRDYFEEGVKSLIHNETNIHGDKNQVAQSTGDNSPINQIQDNSKIDVLKRIIEEDKELDVPKKKKLLGLLEKFNTLKESGENAWELIKQVGQIAIKYIPFFFSLLK
jgi:hypothetical protein